MAWVKQSDRLWSDARFCALSDGAQALWHRANSYLADHLLDGELPEAALKFLQTRKRCVQELEDAGYWVRQPSGGWLAADWQEIIQSKAQVLARRSQTLQRVRGHRNAVSNAVSNGAPGPGPGPGPALPEEEELDLRASSLSETTAHDFRRPVGEPPPGFVETFREPDPEPALEDQILTAWKRAVFERTTRTPASSSQAAAGAKEVAAWLRENVRGDETPLSTFQVALKLYVAEDKKSLVDNAWPLKWLTERLPGYLAAKSTSKPASTNPTHQVWKAPDYAAEQRESEERYLREREEWFAQHPELRAEVESDPLEITPRVVVSIAEAKAPAKAYRPKSPEELAARRAALEEQARAIRAAANAGE